MYKTQRNKLMGESGDVNLIYKRWDARITNKNDKGYTTLYLTQETKIIPSTKNCVFCTCVRVYNELISRERDVHTREQSWVEWRTVVGGMRTVVGGLLLLPFNPSYPITRFEVLFLLFNCFYKVIFITNYFSFYDWYNTQVLYNFMRNTVCIIWTENSHCEAAIKTTGIR
jgi:hypothetical protein